MNEFKLQIVTLDGMQFDEAVQKVIVRTIDGDVGICARHIPYVTALGDGNIRIMMKDKNKYAKCSGGMLCVMPDMVRIVSGTFRWTASQNQIEGTN